MGWGERFAAFPLAQDGCLWGEEGKQKEKEQNERFFCTSHCAIGRCLVGKERNGAASSLRRCAHNPDKVVEGVENCSEYLHFDSLSALFYFCLSARCSKNCELSAKSSPLLTENSPFSRVSSGEVGVSRHVGGKSRLATGKNAGWKKLARRKKNSIFAQVCGVCDIFLYRAVAPHASRRPSARAGTRPATARALLRAPRVAPSTPTFHPIFLPQQQLFSC